MFHSPHNFSESLSLSSKPPFPSSSLKLLADDPTVSVKVRTKDTISFYVLGLHLSTYVCLQPFPAAFLPCQKIKCPLPLPKVILSTCAFDPSTAYCKVLKRTSFGISHADCRLDPDFDNYCKLINFYKPQLSLK